jgi:NAD+ diphosphatase
MFEFDTTPPASRSDALHFVFQDGKLVSDLRSSRPWALSDTDLEAHGWEILRERYIGSWQGRPCFAVELDDIVELDPLRHGRGTLYELLGRVEDPVFALAGRAAQLLAWERDHRYCGRCGEPMSFEERERAMRCGQCDTLLYPRIAPCIIVLICRGEHLLLARNARFPRPFYSTLAGFIEAGENAEQCVHREVREEVGVEVENLRYFGSQAWPFPNQLMLGYFADYAAGEICCEPGEIADAGWFHVSELPLVPPETSISGQLIRSRVDAVGR